MVSEMPFQQKTEVAQRLLNDNFCCHWSGNSLAGGLPAWCAFLNVRRYVIWQLLLTSLLFLFGTAVIVRIVRLIDLTLPLTRTVAPFWERLGVSNRLAAGGVS